LEEFTKRAILKLGGRDFKNLFLHADLSVKNGFLHVLVKLLRFWVYADDRLLEFVPTCSP
jgi:hypothetical protein